LYGGLNKGELLIDTTGLERLGVSVGDRVSFGDVDLTVAEVVVVEPTSLFGGFSFLPKAFITQESFAEANVNPQFLRAEYSYSAKIATLTANEMDLLRAFEDTSSGIDVDIAGQDQMGLQFGLKTVSDFFNYRSLDNGRFSGCKCLCQRSVSGHRREKESRRVALTGYH